MDRSGLEEWKNLRKEILNAAYRRIFEPLKFLYTAQSAAAIVFFAAYIRFNFFEYDEFGGSYIQAVQLILAGISMLLVSILTPITVFLATLEWRCCRVRDAV